MTYSSQLLDALEKLDESMDLLRIQFMNNAESWDNIGPAVTDIVSARRLIIKELERR